MAESFHIISTDLSYYEIFAYKDSLMRFKRRKFWKKI